MQSALDKQKRAVLDGTTAAADLERDLFTLRKEYEVMDKAKKQMEADKRARDIRYKTVLCIVLVVLFICFR